MSGYCLSFVIPWPFAAAGGTKGPLLIPSYLNAGEQLRHILRALAGLRSNFQRWSCRELNLCEC